MSGGLPPPFVDLEEERLSIGGKSIFALSVYGGMSVSVLDLEEESLSISGKTIYALCAVGGTPVSLLDSKQELHCRQEQINFNHRAARTLTRW